uniref:gliding motility lipoprotein GldB n=1 Tax=Sphingobacterium lumbrici TaxID=2559600 RepID=UPI001F15A269|nr:gliding motility lipoprotein GldB [Sphingobacterium lumbrici]
MSSCYQSDTIVRPDVSDMDLQIKIARFDQELSALDTSTILQKNSYWQRQYGLFYIDFMTEMLEVGHPKDSLQLESILKKVLIKKDFADLSTAVATTFTNLERQEKELSQAFKYIKYYYPEYVLPRFIAFISGFSFQTISGEDYLGIGLDMFLGADSEFYPALIQSIPRYISRRFTPENITPRVIETVLRQELFPQHDGDVNMLQHMIYNGKVLYAMDVILEGVADSLKIGYTSRQMEWIQRYQEDVWAWFIQENLLYSTDYMGVQKYFSEAPFTRELGENSESAPKLGSYIGWMIVRKFMERNPGLDLKQLLAKDNAQDILEGSKFRGK